jgi:hypothetical protein
LVDQTRYDIDFQIFRKDKLSANNDEDNLDFEKNETVTTSYSQLVNHKLISINSVSPSRPVWTTGLVYHLPLGINYEIHEHLNYFRDSVRFSNGKFLSGGLAVATHLMFEIGRYEKVIPNFSVGVSYKTSEFRLNNNFSASESMSSSMSVLIGGGVRTRGFKYFSVNTGFSWSQTKKLHPDLEKGVDYDVYKLIELGIPEENYFENKWTPAVFIGIGFHF